MKQLGGVPLDKPVVVLGSAGALLGAMAVTAAEFARQGSDLPPGTAVLLSAGAILAMAAAFVRAAMLRRAREGPQLARALERIVWGGVILYGGEAGGMLVGRWVGVDAAIAIIAIARLLALPLVVMGLVGLCWPPRLSRAQARVLVADALVGGVGLFVLWGLVVYPASIDAAHSASGRVWALVNATAMLLATIFFLILVSAARRRATLPARQLWLVHGSVCIQLVTAVASVMVLDNGVVPVPIALFGQLLGMALFVVFCAQPGLQTEGPIESRARELYAAVVPLLPIPLACMALVGLLMTESGPPGRSVVLGGVLLIFLLLGVVVLRALASSELRGAARERAGSLLSTSTEEEWFQVLVGRTGNLTLVLHRDGRIAYATPSVYRVSGHSAEELRERPFDTLLTPGAVTAGAVHELMAAADVRAGEPTDPIDLLLRGSAGGREIEWQFTALVGLDVEGYLVQGRDVTDERRMAALLAESVSRDTLTGLHNRSGFLTATADRRGKRCMLAINLRRFADFNDQHGHAAGDQVLRHVAQLLRDLPGPVLDPARLSADTFALLVVGSVPDIEVVSATASIRMALQLVTLPDGRPLPLDLAAGYAVSDTDEIPVDELLSRAELAMTRSRSLERSPLVRFDPTLRLVRHAAAAAEADLRAALRERSLVVRYQPIVRLSDGAVVGAEALVRRRRADGSLESPEVFIPLAEQLGFVDEVDHAVLMRALGEMQEVAAVTGRRLPVSVNISASELDDGLEHRVLDALAETGWNADDLIIEVTETALATRTDEASRLLRRLQLAGCHIAMDDFGTGYSSMASLVEMPVDILKIDASFTHRLTAAGRGLSVMRAIVEIGRSLNLVTVAEGLATVEQADLLRGMGCDRGQGYLYAPPLSAEDLADFLRPDKAILTVE